MLTTVRSITFLSCIFLYSMAPAPAFAQAEGSGLAGLLSELILREIRLPMPANPGFSHDAHFTPFVTGDLANPAVGIVDSFTKLLTVQLSTFPLGSSSGGFSYTLDPTLGTFKRASSSFGPAFAERALTVGKGRLSTGATYQFSSFSTFEGMDLEGGNIKFYLRHRECCTPGAPGTGTIDAPDGSRLSPFFEGDVIEAALSLKTHTQTMAFFGNYGLTDRWDVAMAIPVVRVELDAEVQATIQRLSTGTIPIHTFEAGNINASQRTYTRSASAAGVGDVLLRTKYRFLEGRGAGLAAGLDIRLPTGDQDNLLGSGGQGKLYLILSSERGRFGQHANIGYTNAKATLPTSGPITQANQVPNEFNYTFGAEFAAHPRLTLVADLLGRTLIDAGRLEMATKTFEFQTQTPAPAPLMTAFDEFDPRPGHLNLMLGTAGFKFNPGGNLLISANALFPVTDSGLRSRFTMTFGVDYAF